MCFTLELLSQGADFLNCILTNVSKEIIYFIGHDICPLRRISGKEIFGDATANYCFPHGVGVVSTIFNLLCQKFLFGQAYFLF